MCTLKSNFNVLKLGTLQACVREEINFAELGRQVLFPIASPARKDKK